MIEWSALTNHYLEEGESQLRFALFEDGIFVTHTNSEAKRNRRLSMIERLRRPYGVRIYLTDFRINLLGSIRLVVCYNLPDSFLKQFWQAVSGVLDFCNQFMSCGCQYKVHLPLILLAHSPCNQVFFLD